MNRQYDVYGIGHALVDLQYTVEERALGCLGIDKGVMTLIDEQRLTEVISALGDEPANSASGGSAANTMIAATRFGATAYYACQVGDDGLGSFYRDDLEAAGVGTRPGIISRGRTGQCVVMVTPDADRTLNTFLGASSAMGPDQVEADVVEASEFIYLEGYLLTSALGREASRKAQDLARQYGTSVSLTLSDPAIVGAFREHFQTLIDSGVDLLFCNEDEALAYTGETSADRAVAALADSVPSVCVTRGPLGAIASRGNDHFEIPGIAVVAVDTTGAGDSFAGGVLAGLTKGHSLPQAASLGCYAATQVVGAYGPRLEADLKGQIDDIIAAARPAERMDSP